MILKKRKKNFIRRAFSFRMFVLVGVLIIVFLGINLGREYYREHQIQKEIDSLQKEIESLEKNNYKLSQLTEYYQTDEYKEAEVRKRLNMKKEGEKVVIIKYNSANSEQNEIEDLLNDENLPNYIKWWNYFFASK
ncbi:MAG: septum formation initiator family protein [Candidatus Pacebacteria bacterium]|nr:septum formation initiator family protein [Candidatus Paceibacterota bacterium]